MNETYSDEYHNGYITGYNAAAASIINDIEDLVHECDEFGCSKDISCIDCALERIKNWWKNDKTYRCG